MIDQTLADFACKREELVRGEAKRLAVYRCGFVIVHNEVVKGHNASAPEEIYPPQGSSRRPGVLRQLAK
jgi:hypothetical protein